MDYGEQIAALAGLVQTCRPCYVLTGAGISTESGIPDFRSPGTGLWTKYDPMKTASLTALRRDPAKFYEINLTRWTSYLDCQPNSAHLALARLEKLGYVAGVITQNIDGLHRKAGSQRVWEVHGHLRTCRCLQCAGRYPFDLLVNLVKSGQNPPLCEKCGGILRPDVVLFEDRMSDDFFAVTQVLTGCQLLLVVGSSLTVYPVAGLPQLARRVVIINRDPTPWDEHAELVIRRLAGQVFTDLMAALGEQM
ncbi:MAG: NAD-dependent deacylase [Bacillota bacterium]